MRECGSEAGCRRAQPVRHQESWRRCRAITQPRECTTVLNYVGHARVGPENLSLVLRRMPVSGRQYGHASSESCEYPSHVDQVDSYELQEEICRVLDLKPQTFEARMVLCCLTSREREEPSLLKFRRLGHREGEIRDLITERQFETCGACSSLTQRDLVLTFSAGIPNTWHGGRCAIRLVPCPTRDDRKDWLSKICAVRRFGPDSSP